MVGADAAIIVFGDGVAAGLFGFVLGWAVECAQQLGAVGVRAFVLDFSQFFNLYIFGFELLFEGEDLLLELADLLGVFGGVWGWVLLLSNAPQPGNFLLLVVAEFLGTSAHVVLLLDG